MRAMGDALSDFMAGRVAVGEESATWGTMRLRIGGYLSDEMPALRYITSARAVVFRGDHVLVVRDPADEHILPGGRLEAEESPEEAVRREVLEETGWTLGTIVLIGFLHLHHLSPRPPDFPYPYPDFVQTVFAGEAETFSEESREEDEYVIAVDLRPIEAVRAMDPTLGQMHFLDAAVRALRPLADEE